MRLVRLLSLCALLWVCCACSPWLNRPDSYTVKSGDTLYSIAMRFEVDYHELARINRLDSDYRIRPGQVLRLNGEAEPSRPALSGGKSVAAAASKAPQVIPNANFQWQWPCKSITYVETRQPNGSVGLSIQGKVGQDVYSSAGGKVVYAGSGLLGYGKLVIVKHDEVYLSAYGHLQAIQVKEGTLMSAGQKIGTMGTNSTGSPSLYFEIRTNGVTLMPTRLLPRLQ